MIVLSTVKGNIHSSIPCYIVCCDAAMDISSDLTALGRTPIAVISAGVKSILDIPKTLEYLVTILKVELPT